ncbi:hypothetical protein P4O66_014339, partial [Electrophorus voltai]
DVTGRPRPLVRGPHEEDEEDTQSLKSLPTVMNTLAFDPKVKKSHRLSRGQVITELSLPPLVTSRCTLAVKGSAYTRVRDFLPAVKSKSVERPPGRAGHRPDNPYTGLSQHPHTVGHPSNAPAWENDHSGKMAVTGGSCPYQPLALRPRMSLAPRITPQRVVVQTIHPITPSTMEETKKTGGAHQPLRPVLTTSQEPKHGALQRLLDEGYLPRAGDPHLLEPFSGFQEHLCRQLLNSPLPCGAALSRSHPPFLLWPADHLHAGAALPEPQARGTSRTVELCNSRGRRLPRITMTCPTPSPKHLHHSGRRHMA